MTSQWGLGRVEVLSFQAEITAHLECGGSVKQIYEELKAAGKITVSRPAFYKHVRRLCTHQQPPPQPQQQTSTPPRPSPVEDESGPSVVVPALAKADGKPPQAEAPGGLRRMKVVDFTGWTTEEILADQKSPEEHPETEKDD